MKKNNYSPYLLIKVGVFSLILLTGYLVNAETLTKQLDQIKVELSYLQDNSSSSAQDINIKIFRKGKTIVDKPLNINANSNSFDLKIVDLDKDREPEIMVNYYSGGVHCCNLSLIYRYDSEVNTYSDIEAPWRQNGAEMNDLEKDGIPEFFGGDDTFNYKFSSFVSSIEPIKIWRYKKGKMQDVTRQYPQEIKKYLPNCNDKYTDPLRGCLSAYLATQYLLNKEKSGWEFVQKSYTQNDRQAYFIELRNHLQETGYIQTRNQKN